MSETNKEQAVSPERLRFLQEMGNVVVEEFSCFNLDPDGVVEGAYGRWVPLEEQAPLDTLFKAMRLAGLEPAGFKFQQYDVIVANPYHGARVDLKFPAQLAIKGLGYKGLHQLDLVLRSPFVAATEIRTGLGMR